MFNVFGKWRDGRDSSSHEKGTSSELISSLRAGDIDKLFDSNEPVVYVYTVTGKRVKAVMRGGIEFQG